MNSAFPLLFLFVSSLIFTLPGCSSKVKPDALPKAKVYWDKKDSIRISSGLALQRSSNNTLTYRLISEESISDEPIYQVKNDTLEGDAGYVFRELYNIYESADGATEYYVSEFVIAFKDTHRIQTSLDYRIIMRDDSALFFVNEVSKFRLGPTTQISGGGKSYEIFEILGYPHAHSAADSIPKPFTEENPPIYRQYWTPGIGTLLVKFTDDIRLELHTSQVLPDSILIDSLLRQVKDKR